MDDPGQVFPEHFAELAFDFLLEVSTDDFDAVESTTDVDVLQRVVLEDQGDAFGFADYEDENRTKVEQRELERHRHEKRLRREERRAHR